MEEKTILVACSGLNPRGNVTRAAVDDITKNNENFDYACVVACGGGNKKHIQKTIDNKTISIDGCQKACPTTIIEKLGGKIDKTINVKELLTKHDSLPNDSVRIGEKEEKGIQLIKEEIYKISKTI